MRLVLTLVFLCCYIMPADAALPEEQLADPVLEERARNLDLQLRCVVCQGQSIADSNAPLASDLRKIVRERITLGESDAEVISYIAERYGDYVLLKPPVQPNTLVLWVFPVIALLLGGGIAIWAIKNASQDPQTDEDMSV